MKAVLIIALTIISDTAFAGPINLMCGGTMNQYQPKRIEGTVAPGATVVDLDQNRIETPVGRFRISTVTDTSISFDDPGKQLVVFGTLDRLSGAMTVSWRTAEEDAKMKANMSAQNSMYAELQCSASKRLF